MHERQQGVLAEGGRENGDGGTDKISPRILGDGKERL